MALFGLLLAVAGPVRAQEHPAAEAGTALLLEAEAPSRGVLRRPAVVGRALAEAEQGQLLEFLRRAWRDGAWADDLRVRFTYDAAGVPQEWVLARWDTTAWVQQQRRVYAHDARGRLVEETDQVRDGDSWRNVERSLLAYDQRGNLVEQVLQRWEAAAWINDLRLLNTFGADDRRERAQIDRWIEGRWEPEEQDRLVYDARGNLVERRLLRWNGSDWVGRVREYTVYNEADQPTETVRQVWTGSEWVPCLSCRRSQFAYDRRGRLVEEQVQYWIGQWVDLAREHYVVDTRGHAVERIVQSRSATLWLNTERTRYAYDVRGREVERINELWLGDWVHRYQDLSTYAAGGPSLPEAPRLSGPYPNPFTRTTVIPYFLPEPQPVTLTVYDLLGREVARLADAPQAPGAHEVLFDATGLAAGTYLCRLQAGSRTITRTLVRTQ